MDVDVGEQTRKCPHTEAASSASSGDTDFELVEPRRSCSRSRTFDPPTTPDFTRGSPLECCASPEEGDLLNLECCPSPKSLADLGLCAESLLFFVFSVLLSVGWFGRPFGRAEASQ